MPCHVLCCILMIGAIACHAMSCCARAVPCRGQAAHGVASLRLALLHISMALPSRLCATSRVSDTCTFRLAPPHWQALIEKFSELAWATNKHGNSRTASAYLLVRRVPCWLGLWHVGCLLRAGCLQHAVSPRGCHTAPQCFSCHPNAMSAPGGASLGMARSHLPAAMHFLFRAAAGVLPAQQGGFRRHQLGQGGRCAGAGVPSRPPRPAAQVRMRPGSLQCWQRLCTARTRGGCWEEHLHQDMSTRSIGPCLPAAGSTATLVAACRCTTRCPSAPPPRWMHSRCWHQRQVAGRLQFGCWAGAVSCQLAAERTPSGRNALTSSAVGFNCGRPATLLPPSTRPAGLAGRLGGTCERPHS